MEAVASCASGGNKDNGDLSKDAWQGAYTPISQTAVGDAKTVSAGYIVRLDGQNLYVAVQVNKHNPIHDSPDSSPWMDDSVELFLDMQHARTHQHPAF